MATLSHLNPAAMGHSNAMAELDILLQDLYVANNEESRLIEKEKQYIQALEGSILERQKLIQNFQKETSKADKDIKFAHQQFKNNRTNCESLKSQYSVLQQHENSLYKKQDEVNSKWKIKRSELSKKVDQYEGTWQTYQAKYEESELAMQLLDTESQVTQVNNRVVTATQTVEQLQHSILKLQQLDSNENQIFKSLNDWVIKIAEIKHASNEYRNEISKKNSECDKLQQKGESLKLQETQLCQRLDEVQKAKQDQDIRRAKLIEAEKQKCAEQAPRHGTLPSQGKAAHRYITPNTEKAAMPASIITTSRSSPVANHTSRSNTAPIPASKAPPFIQMPVLSSPARPQAKPASTSLGVDKGVKLSTVPSHFTLQYPGTPPHRKLTSQAGGSSSQSVTTGVASYSPVTTPHQLLVPQHSGVAQGIVNTGKQNNVVRRSPPKINVSPATSSPSVSPNITTPSGNHGNKQQERPGIAQQTQDTGLGEQQPVITMDQSMAYDLPLPPDDDDAVLNNSAQTPRCEGISSNSSTPTRAFNFDGYREEIEAIKQKSPGFMFPSRPMFSAGSAIQADPNPSEAMDSASNSASNFQESPFFSSIFSGNNFASEKQANSNTSQMFSSPRGPNTSPQATGNSNNLEKSQAREDTGGFMMPPSDNTRMNFSPSDMFGPGSPVPAPDGAAFSLFGGSNDAGSTDNNSSGGFSFSFGGGGPDSPSIGAASSQPFSMF